jgi:hypothetical protein
VAAAFLLLATAWCCIGLPLLNRVTPAVHAQSSTVQHAPAATDRTSYAGDAACLPCHKQESQAYRYTSHHLTSQKPDAASILGTFKEGKSILIIANPKENDDDPRLYFEMDAKDGSFYQTAIAERAGKRLTHQEKIDLVIGSGTRGQTYLFWSGNELFELPVSYWKDGNQWINSPGYKDGTANFERHVDPRCLECHSTFIQPLSVDPQTNIYKQESLLLGISCENCHGPGSNHIAQEQSHTPKTQKPQDAAILNPAKFPRDRQVDQCALCHNGTDRTEIAPAFSYQPGQPLDKYLGANPADISDQPDVHGNQVGLLKKSRCYLSSPTMSCSTCHDVHAPERTAAAYSDRCLSCHRWQSCGALHKLGDKIKQNCVDCHMPLMQTSAIVSVTAGRILRTSIRTHWIKVYPEAAAQVELH